jgi:hypothetical protein
MTNPDQEIPWEGQLTEASHAFGIRCRELRDGYPYGTDAQSAPVLVQIMDHFVTELWDQCFSQTEIDSAFKSALEGLPRYAAGEERRGDKA